MNKLLLPCVLSLFLAVVSSAGAASVYEAPLSSVVESSVVSFSAGNDPYLQSAVKIYPQLADDLDPDAHGQVIRFPLGSQTIAFRILRSQSFDDPAIVGLTEIGVFLDKFDSRDVLTRTLIGLIQIPGNVVYEGDLKIRPVANHGGERAPPLSANLITMIEEQLLGTSANHFASFGLIWATLFDDKPYEVLPDVMAADWRMIPSGPVRTAPRPRTGRLESIAASLSHYSGIMSVVGAYTLAPIMLDGLQYSGAVGVSAGAIAFATEMQSFSERGNLSGRARMGRRFLWSGLAVVSGVFASNLCLRMLAGIHS